MHDQSTNKKSINRKSGWKQKKDDQITGKWIRQRTWGYKIENRNHKTEKDSISVEV